MRIRLLLKMKRYSGILSITLWQLLSLIFLKLKKKHRTFKGKLKKSYHYSFNLK